MKSKSTAKKIAIGELQDLGPVKIFFGNRLADEVAVRGEFSDLAFARLKQTHSDLVVETLGATLQDQPRPEADAHFTTRPRLALAVQTADCLPVLVYDPSKSVIAAIHAGWRGVASDIIPKALATIGGDSANTRVWIGPHIRRESFEVGAEVAEILLASFVRAGGTETVADWFQNREKARIDLAKIALAQLHCVGIASKNIYLHTADTFADAPFASFRRDRETASRQLSFICMEGAE